MAIGAFKALNNYPQTTPCLLLRVAPVPTPLDVRGEGQGVITGCDEAGKMRPCVVNGRRGLKKTGGIPVLAQKISYVGAVDPRKGMWRYGVDESKLPEP